MTTAGWISIGIVVFALAVLVMTGLGTAGRLRPLGEAVARLLRRRDEAARLQEAVTDMQTDLGDLRKRLALTQEHLDALKARRRAGRRV